MPGRLRDPVAAAAFYSVNPPTAAEVQSVLSLIADELEALNARQAALWNARRVAYVAGRALDPPLTQVELAEAARVSQVQVNRALAPPEAKAQARAKARAKSG